MGEAVILMGKRAGGDGAVRLDVPLFRQRFDPDNWQSDGFRSMADSLAWSNRSCGIACVRMAIAYFHHEAPSMAALLGHGLRMNGYGKRGWVHQSLAELLELHGLSARPSSIGKDVREMVGSLTAGNPLIASVTDQFPCDGREGGHLVVVTGIHFRDDEPVIIYFNDPSAWGQEHCQVQVRQFLCSFSGRIIKMACSASPNRVLGEAAS